MAASKETLKFMCAAVYQISNSIQHSRKQNSSSNFNDLITQGASKWLFAHRWLLAKKPWNSCQQLFTNRRDQLSNELSWQLLFWQGHHAIASTRLWAPRWLNASIITLRNKYQRRIHNQISILDRAFHEKCYGLSAINYSNNKLHLRCLTRFWIRLWILVKHKSHHGTSKVWLTL